VARRYAGIMAMVAMSVVLLRALKGGDGCEAAVVSALGWMATLGLVGLVVGAIAQATVDESVRVHMEQQLAASSRPSAPGSARG
jgi:hypothetical protein